MTPLVRTVFAAAILGACAGATHPGWTIKRVSGPVVASCTITPGPCQDVCGDRAGCSCTCAVDGLTDLHTRTIVLSDSPQADAAEVRAHERCHAMGGSEQECQL